MPEVSSIEGFVVESTLTKTFATPDMKDAPGRGYTCSPFIYKERSGAELAEDQLAHHGVENTRVRRVRLTMEFFDD